MSRTAKMMITQGGFAKNLGQVAWTSGNQQTFVGQQAGQPADCSGETSDEIEQEVKSLVDRAYRFVNLIFLGTASLHVYRLELFKLRKSGKACLC